MIRSLTRAFAILITLFDSPSAADLDAESPPSYSRPLTRVVVSGRAAVVDGHTLWFPTSSHLVRLSDIDSCDLVQWSFDPNAPPSSAPSLAPTPCGAFARAWLKRTIGRGIVHCDAVDDGNSTGIAGRCRAGDRDLALEMVKVGWAKLSTSGRRNRHYVEAQQAAIASRHGMWRTYVLDMPEWRRKAIDRTLGREPRADVNLLRDRNSEISPPFLDARRQPRRWDR